MKYIGTKGKEYTVIEPALGKGGEGSIYRISGMPGYVLKIFLDSKRTETRHRKLLTMIAMPLSPAAMQQITWPIDVVYENGQFIGYVMPEIKNNEDLNVMYSGKYSCTLSEKITLAKNLCAAINAVHNAGQVCGDLNPKNIGVDPHNARITLVDTDSYHITERNSSRVYRCEVGMPEYLPREIQEKMKNGYQLSTAPLPTFTKYSDLFALAVHIFALLMNGCHPFACAVNGKVNIGSLAASQPSVTAPQPIDNICNGFFPFYTKRSGITIPKYAPEFEMLPQNIQDLFIRAFIDGHSDPTKRPDSVEWYNALSAMQQNLKVCAANKNHMYPAHLNKCPFCEVDKKMRGMVSGVTGGNSGGTRTHHTTTNTATSSTANTTTTYHSSDNIMESAGMFWFLTLAITLGAQAFIQYMWGDAIVGSIFGYEYGGDLENAGMNIAIWLGPWGFVICGLIGTLLYNICGSKNGRLYGYKWYHYVLSIVVSFASSAAYILVILIITFAIILAVGALICAVICGFISGS